MGIKGWIDNLKGVTAAVTAGGAGSGAGATLPTAEPDGPQFAPIEGVDLTAYTRVVYGLTIEKITEEGPVLARVEQEGLDPTTWKTVADGWNERIINDNAVKARFGQLYFALDADRPIEGTIGFV